MTTSITAPALLPTDPAYAAAVAPFVTTVTPRPDMVVEARSPADVVAAVRWAREEGRAVTIQATGHQLVTDLAGSVLISTRHLDDVRVDPATRTARAQAGALNVDIKKVAAKDGLWYPPDPSLYEISTIGGMSPPTRAGSAA